LLEDSIIKGVQLVKIFFSNDAPIIKYGMAQAFADLGHQVSYTNVVREKDWVKILDRFQPDYVFSEGGWETLNILFPILHQKNVPHIFWAIEDPVFFNSLSLPHARESAYVFTTCKESIPAYKQNGIDAYLLPFACNPRFHRSVSPDSRFRHDMVFVGNNYDFPERIKGANQVLSPLMEGGYNLKIYGLQWWVDPERPFNIEPRFYGGYLPPEDLPAICASVPIILGLHSVVDSQTMMSMRTFEVLGCGGFHLTQWTPAVEYYFKNHHHLVWTKSAEETLDLVNYYLARPEERAKIARCGQQEVYEKHTYHHRAKYILSFLQDGKERNSIVVPAGQKQLVIRFGSKQEKGSYYKGAKISFSPKNTAKKPENIPSAKQGVALKIIKKSMVLNMRGN